MRHEPSSHRRYLSVWLRRLATDRIARESQAGNSRLAQSMRIDVPPSGALRAPPSPAWRGRDAPLVIAAEVKSALRLTAVNDAAARLGLKSGMALADARAMYPAIAVADADPEADRRLLEAIADWC